MAGMNASIGSTAATSSRRRSTRVSARVAAVPASATLAIDSKAKALRQAGEDVISFGAGEPDFPTPPAVVAAAAAACADPRNHRYSPTAGLPDLRSAIAEATLRDSGWKVSASQVLVTNGGKHAVATALATLVDPGDEVLLPSPYWTTYPEAVALAGGTTVFVEGRAEQGFLVSVEQLDRAVTERTKVLILVSPSNPTGALYGRDQLAEIGQWALERDLWVLSDDIYEHLVYGDEKRWSLPELVPDLTDRLALVNGVAKTYAMTGWRVGWMVAPADVSAAAINLQSQVTSNVANVTQRAALEALRLGPEAALPMREAFDRRRRRMLQLLRAIPGIECAEPKGAFYAFPSVASFLGRSVGGVAIESSAQLAEVLLDQAKVAVVPGEAFGAPGFVRMSYALGDSELETGLRRMGELLSGPAS